MNTNYLHQTETCRSKKLSICLAPIAYDERTFFVDSVCAVLIDSRFGSRRSATILDERGYLCGREPVTADDMFFDGDARRFSVRTEHAVGRRYAIASAGKRLGRIGFAMPGKTVLNASPSTFGRGSPPGIVGRIINTCVRIE